MFSQTGFRQTGFRQTGFRQTVLRQTGSGPGTHMRNPPPAWRSGGDAAPFQADQPQPVVNIMGMPFGKPDTVSAKTAVQGHCSRRYCENPVCKDVPAKHCPVSCSRRWVDPPLLSRPLPRCAGFVCFVRLYFCRHPVRHPYGVIVPVAPGGKCASHGRVRNRQPA